MAEYIERGAAAQAVMEAKWESGSDAAIAMEIIAGAPAADVEPVRHARWKTMETYRDGGTAERCSLCHELTFFHRTTHKKYCPNCGAKMDKAQPETGAAGQSEAEA